MPPSFFERLPKFTKEGRETAFKEGLKKLIAENDHAEVAGRIIDKYSSGGPQSPKMKEGYQLFLEALRDYTQAQSKDNFPVARGLRAMTPQPELSPKQRFIADWHFAVGGRLAGVSLEEFDPIFEKVFGNS